MTTEDYLLSLEKLGMGPYGIKARTALGLQTRQLARLATGDTRPSPMLVRLLEALIALKTR